MRNQLPAGLGRLPSVARTFEQRRTVVACQALQPARDRRVFHTEPARRRRVTAGARRFEEIAQVRPVGDDR